MFKKEDGTHHFMTTPPSSPSFLYSGGDFEINDHGSRLHARNSSPYANSPPVSPMKSLSLTTQDHTIPLEQDSPLPPLHAFDSAQQHTILYSGEMILCSPQSRFSRQKRCYCILTPTNLVRFKSFDKAKKAYPVLKGGDAKLAVQKSFLQDQKVLVALEHVFAIYKIQLSSFQTAIRINFVDSTDLSKQPGSITLVPTTNDTSTSSSVTLVSIWIHALRTALEPYLPGLITVGAAEQRGAIERTKKQNDHSTMNHPPMIHKVMLKTKKSNPKSASGTPASSQASGGGNLVVNHMMPSSASGSTITTTTPASTSSTGVMEQKDIYIPVIFLLGVNSLYVLPARSDHDDYRRYVSRDRYGLMAITGITVHDDDDTITIDICSVQGPSHRLKLISSVGRLLVCAIQKAIQQLVPHFPSLPYTLICPTLSLQQQQRQQQQQHRGSSSSSSSLSFSATTTDPIHINTIGGQTITALSPIAHWLRYLSQPWQQQKITSLQKRPSESISLYTVVTTYFDAVLMAYCAALNLDKRRFRYTMEKSQRKSRLYNFTVLPSNEINGNYTTYSKYELLALFRAIRHIDYFETVSFKDIRLAPLAAWFISKDDGWTQQDNNSMCFPTMLANEIFLLLSYNNNIQSLDLSGKHNAPRTSDSSPGDTSNTSLTRSPTTRSLIRTNTLTDVTLALDQMSPTSSASSSGSQQPTTGATSKCQQCMVQAILLSIQTNKSLNLSHLTLDGHTLHEQDTDLLTQLILATATAPASTTFDTPDLLPMMGLRSLSLRRAHMTTAGLEELLLSIIQGPAKDRMECLDLQENDGQVSIEVFTQVWQQCTRLSQFGVSCHFRPKEKLDLVRFPKVMKKLDLSGSILEDEHLLELCAWLTYHANNLRPPTKTQFDLCLVLARCGLHGQHVHQLVHAVSVPHHRRLHFSLELGDNPLTKQVVYQPWLWSSLSKYGPTSLKLQRVMWESATLRELFESLIQNKMVEKLDLSYAIMDKCNEHDTTTTTMTSPVVEERQPTVTAIPTTYNSLSGRTSTRMSISSTDTTPATISTSSQISTGDLAPPTSIPLTFDPTTVQALANLLQKMTHLADFSMDADQQEVAYTPMTTNSKSSPPKRKPVIGAAGHLLSSTFRHLALSPTTSFSSSITSISIKNQGLGDTTIHAVCQWGKQCPSLQSLYVDGNMLTIAGFRSLLDLVTTNSSVYDVPRPEMDFRRELHRLESEAWQLQESEGELQYMVIHVDSRRAHALIEDQAAAREAIMVDRSQLPIVADQLEQQVQANTTLYQRKSRHMVVQPYWPSPTTPKMDRPPSSFSTTSISSSSSSSGGSVFLAGAVGSSSAPPTRKPSLHQQQQQQQQQQPSPSPSSSTFMARHYRQRRPSSTSSSSVQSFYHEWPAELLADALPPPTGPLPAIPSSNTPFFGSPPY